MKVVTLKALVAFTSLALTANALNVPRSSSSFLVKEDVSVPTTWVQRSVASNEQTVALRFAMKQRDVETLEARLLQTSDPTHELYGRHLSQEEVSSYLAPEKRTVDEVEHWLRSNDVHIDEALAARSPSNDAFTVHVPVWKARELLDADFGVYEHKRTGSIAIRAQKYSLPEQVHDHLDYVGPLTLFTEPKTHKSGAFITTFLEDDADQSELSDDSQPCNTKSVTSLCLRTFYKTVNYVPKAIKAQKIGISGFLGQYANFADYFAFLKEQRPDAYAGKYNFTVESIANGMNLQSTPGVEANLDTQTIGGFSYPIPFEYYTTGGSPPYKPDDATPTNTNEPYEQELNYLLGMHDNDVPKVLSTSYGDDEQSVPSAYAKRVCNLIMALGARGVSTIYSSGDNGVGADGTCYSNGATSANGTYQFLPAFPASCPYATTVGATQAFSPEVAVDAELAGFYSGGGFSNIFSRPSYQKDAVDNYVHQLGKQYKGLYNKHGRGYPDVAAQGSLFRIRYDGKWGLVGGTSAAAPTFASVIALLNDRRLSEGKSALGFLNPLIYSRFLGTPALNDITSGSSAGCNTTGFAAAKGWDAVSGAGTPNFIEMSKRI